MTLDQLGPLASLVLEIPSGRRPARGLEHILDLVNRRQIRLLDVELLRRNEAGTLEVTAQENWEPYLGANATELTGTMSGLLDGDDHLLLTAELAEDSSALVVIYEWLLTLSDASLWEGDGIRVVSEDALTADELLNALEHTAPASEGIDA